MSASPVDAGAILERALAYPFPAPDGSYELRDGHTAPCEPGAAPDGAVALLAFGANASPSRLVEKLGPQARTVVLAATLEGFDVVFSAHVSLYGAIPGALIRSSRSTLSTHVLFCDPEQLAVLDASEPNYRRVTLHGIALRLEGGGELETIEAYASRHGALRVDGRALALAAVPARGRTLPAGSQADALGRARDRLAPGASLEEFVVAHAGDPAVAGARTSALRTDAVQTGL